MRWTQADIDRLQLQTGVRAGSVSCPQNKYNAKPTVVDGIRFASKAEAKRYGELQLLVKAGTISGLELQPRYDLEVNGRLVCEYVADFRYRCHFDSKMVIEDVKGVKTPAYLLKKKLMLAVHGIEIVEVTA